MLTISQRSEIYTKKNNINKIILKTAKFLPKHRFLPHLKLNTLKYDDDLFNISYMYLQFDQHVRQVTIEATGYINN